MDELLMLIICSPSGAGKTTLTRRLLGQFTDFTFSVSHTTRKPRSTEVHGQDYHFVEKPTFESMVERGDFAEWARVHDNLYGTSLAELQRARDGGKRGIVFDVDYQGARQIMAKLPQVVSVFILPPSMDELLRRLRGRGSEDEQTIQRRFARSQIEIEHYPFFDYLIVNESVDHATAELFGIARAELTRRWRMAGRAEQLLRDTRKPA